MATDEQESMSPKSTDETKGGAQKLCDAYLALNLEELLSYEQIFDIIGRDPQQDGRSVCLRAADMVLRKYGIKIVCELRKGYKRVGFEGRREWIVSKGEQVQRVNVRRFITASHIEHIEFQAMTNEQKQKLTDEQTRVGMNLAITERLNKIKRLPPVERVKLVDLSNLGQVFARKSK